MRTILASLVIILLLSGHVAAGGGGNPFAGATEFTQLLNNAELIDIAIANARQIANQLQAIANMVQNTTGLPNPIWGDTMQRLNDLGRIVRDGQALAYSLSNVDAQFRARFNDYAHYLANTPDARQYSSKYSSWTTTTNDTIRASMKSANLQWQQFVTEESTMRQLEAMSATAAGRMQAVQAGNQIAAQTVRQLQKLRELMMSQMQMQAAYMATRNEKDALQQTRTQRFYQGSPTTIIGDERGY